MSVIFPDINYAFRMLVKNPGFTIIAVIALGIGIGANTAIGLYGVISYSFAQRTQERGIRKALGARAGNVLGMVLWFGLKLAVVGIAIGIVGAIVLTRLLSSMLFGVNATDPLTMIGGAVFLVAIAVIASYVPARRATRIDPMVALRYE